MTKGTKMRDQGEFQPRMSAVNHHKTLKINIKKKNNRMGKPYQRKSMAKKFKLEIDKNLNKLVMKITRPKQKT